MKRDYRGQLRSLKKRYQVTYLMWSRAPKIARRKLEKRPDRFSQGTAVGLRIDNFKLLRLSLWFKFALAWLKGIRIITRIRPERSLSTMSPNKTREVASGAPDRDRGIRQYTRRRV